VAVSVPDKGSVNRALLVEVVTALVVPVGLIVVCTYELTVGLYGGTQALGLPLLALSHCVCSITNPHMASVKAYVDMAPVEGVMSKFDWPMAKLQNWV